MQPQHPRFRSSLGGWRTILNPARGGRMRVVGLRRLGRTGVPTALALSVALLLVRGGTVEAAQLTSGGFTTAATVSRSSGGPGTAFGITANVTANSSRSALVDIEVYDPTGTRVHQQFFDGQAFRAGQSRSFATSWTSSASAPTGTYTVVIGVFGTGWSTLHHWNGSAATLSLTAGGGASGSVTATASASPQSAAPGTSVALTATVRSTSSRTALVDLEVYGPSGTRVFQRFWDSQSLQASTARTFSASWQVPTGASGPFTVKVGVFQPAWNGLLAWNNGAATVTVGGGTPSPTPTATPAPTATSTPSPTPSPSPSPTTPPGNGRFVTLAPGSALPSGAECVSRVRRSSWEPRPENYTANHTVPSGQSASSLQAVYQFNPGFAGRVDGNFTGTTDEIIQWAACKWGFDEDITRARAVTESWWRQSVEGDVTNSSTTCAQIGKSAPCAESYGLLQVRFTAHPGTYPKSVQSTAFNADYALALLRTCYEGNFNWLGSTYGAGDEWGCVGFWFAGNWHSSAANDYINVVRGHSNSRTWAGSGF